MKNILGKAVRLNSNFKHPLYNVIVFYNGRKFYIDPKKNIVIEMRSVDISINIKRINEVDVPEPWQLIHASIYKGRFII